MANRPAFGRRIASANPQQPTAAARAERTLQAAANDAAPERTLAPAADSESPSVDDEVRAWKQARGRTVPIPWKQLSFTASACFGIAGFVLPDSVNNVFEWLLYALAAASFYAGFRSRRHKRQAT